MNSLPRIIVVLTAVLVVLAGLPGVVGAVDDTSTVIAVGPPDDRATASPTDVSGELILGEDRDMAAADGATGTITVTIERPAAAPKNGLPNGRKIVREVGKK